MTTTLETGVERILAENPGEPGIEIDDLSVRCGAEFAVRNLSMHVPRGAVYGLVGPSGAGKSVTMRTLATLLQPAGGTALVDGIDIIDDPAAVRRRIGYMPDVAGFYEDLTVYEYLDFYGALYQIPERRRRQSTDELIELFDLSHHRNHPVKILSRSMKQQLGLARCLVHDPSVLLLDEPAAGMDPQARLELRDILQELAQLGKTIIISSHVLSELAAVCTHLGFMRAGELIAEGETDDIIRAVSTENRLRIHLVDMRDRDAARALLESHPSVRGVENQHGLELIAWFTGSRRDLATLLERLYASGISVSEFAIEHRTLDDIFPLFADIRHEE